MLPHILNGTLREHYVLPFSMAAVLPRCRLCRSVDSIALEVERLSEGQRFTARLMSERQGIIAAVKPESPARVITPH